VVTGPVFGKRSKRIGTNRVAVPKGFYKALFSPDTEPPAMIGFYFPNQYSKDPIQMAAIPIDSVEGICECNMYSTLPVPLQSKLEVNLDTSKWF
jgi:endonuclease G